MGPESLRKLGPELKAFGGRFSWLSPPPVTSRPKRRKHGGRPAKSPRLATGAATAKRLDVLLKRFPIQRDQLWCLYWLEDFDQGHRSGRSSATLLTHRFGVVLTSRLLLPRRLQCY